MPQYKLKEGKLVRRNSKGEKQSFTTGDVVDMTVEQAKTFGLALLERQHADEQEAEQEPKLTVNPEDEKQAAKKPAQKQAEKKA